MDEQGARDLDAFFTMPEVAAFCVEKVSEVGWLSNETRVLEPSSGDGVFLKYIPQLVCMDLNPRHPEAKQQDFLTWKPAENEAYDLIIGNPPFGRRNKFAVPFLNHAAQFCNRIAFILPDSFKRPCTIDRIDVSFWPIAVYDLPSNKFRVGDAIRIVQCSLFLWEKKKVARPLFSNVLDVKTNIPKTVKTVADAEYIIKNRGASSGKIIKPEQYTMGTAMALNGGKDRFLAIDWKPIVKNSGAGQKSLPLIDIHLAFRMQDLGLDYTTGALGYLEYEAKNQLKIV